MHLDILLTDVKPKTTFADQRVHALAGPRRRTRLFCEIERWRRSMWRPGIFWFATAFPCLRWVFLQAAGAPQRASTEHRCGGTPPLHVPLFLCRRRGAAAVQSCMSICQRCCVVRAASWQARPPTRATWRAAAHFVGVGAPALDVLVCPRSARCIRCGPPEHRCCCHRWQRLPEPWPPLPDKPS